MKRLGKAAGKGMLHHRLKGMGGQAMKDGVGGPWWSSGGKARAKALRQEALVLFGTLEKQGGVARARPPPVQAVDSMGLDTMSPWLKGVSLISGLRLAHALKMESQFTPWNSFPLSSFTKRP